MCEHTWPLTCSLCLVQHDPAYVFNVDEVLLLQNSDDIEDDFLLDPDENEAVDEEVLRELKVREVLERDAGPILFPGRID